jgi:molybdopterin/thiamine biosynthesis adenylyltransferase
MGVIQVVEVLKHLTGIGEKLINKILQFDAMSMDITVIDVEKDPVCALCGIDSSLR